MRIDDQRHLSNSLRTCSSKSFLSYWKDGVDSQFLSYLYPCLSIFCPSFLSFICGTLKMALKAVFLSYLCPSFDIYRPCLYHIYRLCVIRTRYGIVRYRLKNRTKKSNRLTATKRIYEMNIREKDYTLNIIA